MNYSNAPFCRKPLTLRYYSRWMFSKWHKPKIKILIGVPSRKETKQQIKAPYVRGQPLKLTSYPRIAIQCIDLYFLYQDSCTVWHLFARSVYCSQWFCLVFRRMNIWFYWVNLQYKPMAWCIVSQDKHVGLPWIHLNNTTNAPITFTAAHICKRMTCNNKNIYFYISEFFFFSPCSCASDSLFFFLLLLFLFVLPHVGQLL